MFSKSQVIKLEGERGALRHLNGQVKHKTQLGYLDPQVFINLYQGSLKRNGGNQREREPPKYLV